MTQLEFSVVEVVGDRVRTAAGKDQSEIRERFARDAESLQARAYLIGSAIGMSAVASVSASSNKGSLAFRFASNSSEGFDAVGIVIENECLSASSLLNTIS